MANTKTNETIETTTPVDMTPIELNMEEKITLRNIAGWTVGFRRIEQAGDVTIPPEGTVRLNRSEVIAQVQNGNRLLTGIDERGSHATVYIEDAPTRVEVDFESDKTTQNILTTDIVKKLFECKNMKSFTERLHECVITRAEKYAIMQMIKREKINDFEKVRTVENYTGFKLEI